jgi:hypothetical protein
LRLSLSPPSAAAESRMAALRSPERLDHQHMRGGGVGPIAASSQQVAAVGRTERPWELDLAEAEEGRYR